MTLYELNPGQKQKFKPSNTAEPQSFTTFLTNCSESIAAMREARTFLYRGIKNMDHDIFLGRPRTNRRTKDTSNSLQKEWDKLYAAAGFTALRSNSIFCAGDYNIANSYGNVYIIFPFNGFSFTRSPKIYDLYNHMQQHDINKPTDLYTNKNGIEKITSLSEMAEEWIENFIENKEPVGDLSDMLVDLRHWFANMFEESSLRIISTYLKKAISVVSVIEKKYKINLAPVNRYITKITAIIKASTISPEQVIEKYQYTNKDFAAALKAKKEIIVNGEYYAFLYEEYGSALHKALKI